MVAVIYIIIMIVAMILAYAMAPRPKGQTPPALSDFNVPTAQDGREVVDCCGTVWIDDPNVIWYGDLRTYPIRKNVG
jgi:hypothetical protein